MNTSLQNKLHPLEKNGELQFSSSRRQHHVIAFTYSIESFLIFSYNTYTIDFFVFFFFNFCKSGHVFFSNFTLLKVLHSLVFLPYLLFLPLLFLLSLPLLLPPHPLVLQLLLMVHLGLLPIL